MEKTLFIVLCLSFAQMSYAQHIVLPFEQNQKWGVLDTTGQVVKKAKYDFVWFFLNPCTDTAITIFQKKEKYGLISRKGKVVQRPTYEGLKFMRSGKYLQFKRGDKWGLYESASNKEVLEAAYDEKVGFFDGSEKWVRINRNGKGGLWVDGEILIKPLYPVLGMNQRGDCPTFYGEQDSMCFWFDCGGNMLRKELKQPEENQPLDVVGLEDLGSFELGESRELKKSPREILQDKMGDRIEVLDLVIYDGSIFAFARTAEGMGIIDYDGNIFLPLIYKEIFVPNNKFLYAGYFPEIRNYLFVRTQDGLGGYMSWDTGKLYLPK